MSFFFKSYCFQDKKEKRQQQNFLFLRKSYPLFFGDNNCTGGGGVHSKPISLINHIYIINISLLISIPGGRVYSLNQLINLSFLYLYIQTILYSKHVFKISKKKITKKLILWNWFVFDILTREIIGTKRSQRLRLMFNKPFNFHLNPKFPWKVIEICFYSLLDMCSTFPAVCKKILVNKSF